MITNIEDFVRKTKYCLGCGQEKGYGTIVCWECFKQGHFPFKTYDGTFAQWLESK